MNLIDSFIPAPYKAVVMIAAEVLLLLGIATIGHHMGVKSERASWEARQVAAVVDTAQKETKAAAAEVQVVTQYIDRVKVIHDKGATIIKEVPVYVTKKADDNCVITNGVVSVLDAAASGRDLPSVSESLTSANDSPSGIALSEVVEVEADNLTTCRATAEQVKAWQERDRQLEIIFKSK
jgi:hypothetical protein